MVKSVGGFEIGSIVKARADRLRLPFCSPPGGGILHCWRSLVQCNILMLRCTRPWLWLRPVVPVVGIGFGVML